MNSFTNSLYLLCHLLIKLTIYLIQLNLIIHYQPSLTSINLRNYLNRLFYFDLIWILKFSHFQQFKLPYGYLKFPKS